MSKGTSAAEKVANKKRIANKVFEAIRAENHQPVSFSLGKRDYIVEEYFGENGKSAELSQQLYLKCWNVMRRRPEQIHLGSVTMLFGQPV